MIRTSVEPRRVAYACPQCSQLVHLTVPYVMHPIGAVVADTDALVRSLALHMRVGCGG